MSLFERSTRVDAVPDLPSSLITMQLRLSLVVSAAFALLFAGNVTAISITKFEAVSLVNVYWSLHAFIEVRSVG